MGCGISNNVILPDPGTAPHEKKPVKRGFFFFSHKTAESSECMSVRNHSTVHITDILVDKTVRDNFAAFVKHEKEAIEEQVVFLSLFKLQSLL